MRRAALILMAAAMLAGCGSSAGSDGASDTTKPAADAKVEETETTEGDITQGLGSKDASADAGEPTCANDSGMGTGKVPVTNNSSKRSDYSITVAAESADGKTQIETTYASAEAVEPGQSAEAELYFSKELPAGAVCKVKEVQRTASS